jgi:superfamily I DNA and/or RNA helicase
MCLCALDKEDQIAKASVVLCTNTLAASLHPRCFAIHIIDEASTASLASVLVGMVLSNQMVVLLGDHKQLPPFCVSSVESQSFFEQTIVNGVRSVM